MQRVKMLPTEAMKEAMIQASIENRVHWYDFEIIEAKEETSRLETGHIYAAIDGWYDGRYYLARAENKLELIADYNRKVGA